MRYLCWLAKNAQEISHFSFFKAEKVLFGVFFAFGIIRKYESVLRDCELLIIIYCHFLEEMLCLCKKKRPQNCEKIILIKHLIFQKMLKQRIQPSSFNNVSDFSYCLFLFPCIFSH